MLRCPVDGYPLASQAIGAASIAACEKCSGVWFTRAALLYPSVDPAALPSASRIPIPATGRRRRVGSCPVCRRVLVPERVEGIDIERCAHCAGVWLDAGEYDAVRHRIEEDRPRPATQTGSEKEKRFAGGIVDPVEVILALLEFFL